MMLFQVLSCLRQLQPRLYSISSSPLECASRVQVTVAEVKYKSLDKARIGVCSTMISERLQVWPRWILWLELRCGCRYLKLVYDRPSWAARGC